ncbi:MAG TPA: hypothetical protein VLZ81_06505, partial [Blastocatellia bacterium]|nr:hypothetical protein [Blastocatellia bacterium]
MSANEFEPIRIVGCDEAGVKKRSGDKQIYVVPFSLSANPPRGWADLFDKSWRALRKSSGATKVDAYLKKGHLVFEASLAEVKPQFPNLKSAVADANTKYREETK